ncbi:MAG: fused MFS/spermidine synthase [Bauldia sp.]
MIRFVIFAAAGILGTVLMAFEMVASRLLTPYFGSGIITWAALISMVLLSIMVGYLVGGALVDRFPTLRLPALLSAIAGVWLLAVPSFAPALLERLMLSFESEVTGVLVSAAILLFLPITALGTYSPIALRLLLRALHMSGRVAGAIYAVSTLGNIVGTLGTVLYLIPRMGTSAITYLLGGVTLACAILLWLAASRLTESSARIEVQPGTV